MPGLQFELYCTAGSVDAAFYPAVAGGTANAMIIASGVEAPSVLPDRFNVANGAQNQGFVTPFAQVLENMDDASGTAGAESQIIIDNPNSTYSIALHMFHIVDTDPMAAGNQYYCEATGTATAGS